MALGTGTVGVAMFRAWPFSTGFGGDARDTNGTGSLTGAVRSLDTGRPTCTSTKGLVGDLVVASGGTVAITAPVFVGGGVGDCEDSDRDATDASGSSAVIRGFGAVDGTCVVSISLNDIVGTVPCCNLSGLITGADDATVT